MVAGEDVVFGVAGGRSAQRGGFTAEAERTGSGCAPSAFRSRSGPVRCAGFPSVGGFTLQALVDLVGE